MPGPRCELRELSEVFYLWDNWIAFDPEEGVYHRYLLSAPREVSPEARHALARIRHATSRCGARWRDRGEVLAPGRPGAFDDVAIWTGTTVIEGGRFALFYTGVSAPDRLEQAIGLATSSDGLTYEKLEAPVLVPRAELGYDPGDDDGVIMAWRDPHVARDPRTGVWHMVFACKRDGPSPRGAIGHAVTRDPSLRRWELCPPLDLPARFVQAEVPAIVFTEHGALLTLSTKDAERDGAAVSGSAWRAFAAPAPSGPWRAASAGPLLRPSDRIYGARPFSGPRGMEAVAFFAPDHPRGLSPTGIAAFALSPEPHVDREAWEREGREGAFGSPD